MRNILKRRMLSSAGHLLIILACIAPALMAQTIPGFPLEKDSRLSEISSSRPFSNAGVELHVKSDSVWFGGGKGLELTTDGGRNWSQFGDTEPFNVPPLFRDNIAAFASNGPVIWVSMAGTFEAEPQDLPRGLGLAVSTDNGATWKYVPQPMEAVDATTYKIQYGQNQIDALAVTTDVQNLTYDIAVTSDAVWTASFAGGLRKSTDGGQTFTPVILPPDFLDFIHPDSTLQFDLSPVTRTFIQDGDTIDLRENFNHRVFSVMATDDNTIWVGTAGGVNLSTDGGISWRKFSYDDPGQSISGDFVVALGHSELNGQELIWASTINAINPLEFRAISYTSNMGNTWSTALRGEFTNNFGVKDSIVYAATQTGIFRTANGGVSWTKFSNFVDPLNGHQITNPRCFAVASQGDVIWIATVDGLVKTTDSPTEYFGSNWEIIRAYQEVGTEAETYAYPNPFAPDDEVCRIHYKTDNTGNITIKVFDYAMFPVRTVLQNAGRTPNMELDEIWDGLDDNGNQVANAVYYIRVEAGDAEAAWTKVIVLQ
jgi:hypothetical protein